MKKHIIAIGLIFIVPLIMQAATPNSPAPDFKESASSGKQYSLDELKGKWVVLEWYNKDCPYVKKHYGSKNMQKLQKTYTQKGVVWLSIISSAKGKQGYLTASEAQNIKKQAGSNASDILLDVDGNMGKAYGAKTTPHMYVINPKGTLVYAGGIDDNNSANPKVIPDSKNFVVAALEQAMNGKKVTTPQAKPYGCSVKY
ncbi:MAG: thioredoxin family protein [Bdellovibrionales bacterium]|nr:thioredoxin family protein [Bdellovibrionales bacterium]